jgi:hypothetical protein
MSLFKHKIVNNGLVLIEQGNLVHLHNQAGVQMVFEAVSVNVGELVLVPCDFKRFNNDLVAINKFVTGKPIVKGLIEYGNRPK